MYPLVEVCLKEFSLDVFPVAEDFSEEVFRQHAPYMPVPVVSISHYKTEC